ncbi:MAG: prepilin-type N-terminal cleavage/methylation domain-containing protein [Lentisphaerae bacterium]|nr:prepilin-type N-terminal cleavage/methylation domain-containing protein [Lentisphaerota bacterium]
MLGRRKGKRNEAGFTMVEVVIASAIFFVIAGGFIAANISAMRTHTVASDLYKATCIARNRIQRARTLDYESLGLLSEYEAAVDEFGNIDQSGVFRRTTTVSNAVPTCTRIVVRVFFPVPNGRLSGESVDVYTMIAEGM